jgi:hypothetical protein
MIDTVDLVAIFAGLDFGIQKSQLMELNLIDYYQIESFIIY